MSPTDCQERLTAAGRTAAGSNNLDLFISGVHSVSRWNWSTREGDLQVAQLLAQKVWLAQMFCSLCFDIELAQLFLERPQGKVFTK